VGVNDVDYATATFEALNTPDTGWFGATMVFNSALPGWTLTRKDGTVYTFGYGAPLQSIRDRYGNQVSVTRAGGQTGNIIQIMASPSGRYIAFHYDAYNHVSYVQDNMGRTVSYVVNPTTNQLTSVSDANGNPTTLGYSTTAGLTQDITKITDARSNFMTIGYTAGGLVSSIDPPINNAWTFLYTGLAPNITAVRSPTPIPILKI
jgi:hypothetical protein